MSIFYWSIYTKRWPTELSVPRIFLESVSSHLIERSCSLSGLMNENCFYRPLVGFEIYWGLMSEGVESSFCIRVRDTEDVEKLRRGSKGVRNLERKGIPLPVAIRGLWATWKSELIDVTKGRRDPFSPRRSFSIRGAPICSRSASRLSAKLLFFALDTDVDVISGVARRPFARHSGSALDVTYVYQPHQRTGNMFNRHSDQFQTRTNAISHIVVALNTNIFVRITDVRPYNYDAIFISSGILNEILRIFFLFARVYLM